ncbi:MAG: hypothetical protein WCG75_08540 [Armatimonadota bacterium]
MKNSINKASQLWEEKTLIRSGKWMAVFSLVYCLSMIGASVFMILWVPLIVMFIHLVIMFGMYDEPVDQPVTKAFNEIGLAMIFGWFGLALFIIGAGIFSDSHEKLFSIAFGIGVSLAIFAVPLTIAAVLAGICSLILSFRK